MKTPMRPFMLTRQMFAIKRDDQPHFIIYPNNGSNAVISEQALQAWSALYRVQSDSLRDSATAGSMFGWEVPAAQEARRWMEGPTISIPLQEGQS